MKRRAFLASAGGLSVSFALGACLPVIPKRPAPSADTTAGWISYLDGRYSMVLPRAEFGQNIATALQQIACDELAIDWSMLTVAYHDTNAIDRVRATVGSDSIRDFALPMAQACATLRDAVAAGWDTGTLDVVERPYGDLRAFGPEAHYVGRPAALGHGEKIVTGQPLYAADIRLPEMVFGRVLRAPVSPEIESAPVKWNLSAAEAVAGFTMLVENAELRQGNSLGLGIIARTPGALDRIEAALAVEWRTGPGFEQQDVDDLIDIDSRQKDGALSHDLADDDIPTATPFDVDLRFDIPLAAHAPIEPRAAVAGFENGRLVIWAGSQDAFYVRDVIADSLGRYKEAVEVRNQRCGGAFGARTICTVELEAAVLTEAYGRPVKVQWTRAQELRLSFHRAPSSHRIRARLKDGRVEDWWHGFASGNILFTNAAMPAWMTDAANFIGDKGVARGAVPPYSFPNRRIEHDQIRLPVLTGPWRGLGAGPNALAVESAMDECARLAAADPVAFRIDHSSDPRLTAVLRQVQAAAGVKPTGIGRGVACGVYKDLSFAAVIADVSLDAAGGIQVQTLYCAHDCGGIINPDQVRAQCEGNLVWGLGMVLSDRLPVRGGGIDASGFDDAPIPLLHQVPEIKVDLLDNDRPPSGAGETAIVAAAGAIANAIRDKTGVRLQRFPLQPGDPKRQGNG